VCSPHWLSDLAWPRAVVLEALPLLAGPPVAVSGYWFQAVQGCPRSSLLGWPAAVYPIPGAGQAGPLAVAAEAGPLPSWDGLGWAAGCAGGSCKLPLGAAGCWLVCWGVGSVG
jgi:hypothetical protein